MKSKIFAMAIAPVIALVLGACSASAPVAEQDEHGAAEVAQGTTRITADAARAAGIKMEIAGPADIGEVRELYGTVTLSPGARSEIRGQFPGRIITMVKNVGDTVRRGELVARIESSESLQTYPVYAATSGVVAERNGNAGDVTFDRALYVLTDPAANSATFNIFPRDLGQIRPAMRVAIQSLDGENIGESALSDYLPEGNAAAGTALMRAPMPRQSGRWRPGMALMGRVVVGQARAPVAVRTAAIQPHDGGQVVFTRTGDTYRALPVTIGRQAGGWSEVLSGITAGTSYVAEGAFVVRADIEKSGAEHDH